MPNLEAEDLLNEVPPQAERALFKGHKSLPRRRQDRPSLEIINQKSSVGINNDTMGNGGDMPMTPTLPLTPPNQVQDETEQESPPSLSGQRSHPLSLRNMPTSGAGSHQFSPPTPDVTPPRVKDTTPKARPVFPSLQSSMSSRADSFQTARENLSDDDITESLYPSPRSMVARKWPKSLPEPSPLANGFEGISDFAGEEQGLGKSNGVKSSDMINDTPLPDKTSDLARTIRLDSSPLPKVHAKGTAKSRAPETVSPEETTPKKMTETKRVQVSSSEAKDSGKVDGESGSDLTDLTDTEQRLMGRVSSWRLSGASFTSTIEAMVIEPSPPKQRTLRHIEKRASLRSVSSPQPRPTRTSAESYGDTGHRLVHKSGRLSNENRNSVAFDMSFPFSTTSTNKGNPEIIPVVVVPRRQSSLKSSAASTRSPSAVRSKSLRRNTSVTRSKNGDQNQAARRRATSEATNSVAGQSQRGSRGRESSRPAIPTRSSSLSAPTSRNNSRTTSLTSESLRRHTEQMQMAFQAPEHQRQPEMLPSPRIVLPEGPHAANIKMDTPVSAYRNAEDVERLHAPSLHFTMSSVVSSSPGPVEVNEATMVTYFPHNNNSLLLIDSKVQPESGAVKALRGQDLSTPYMVSTPQRSAAVLDIESPLRNPRTPPAPPVYAPGLPERKDSGSARNAALSRQGSNRISRGLGSMKRALSARRHSDGARPQPVTRSLSVRSSRSRRAEKANDTQLNSFWRPRPFWDGFDSSLENERGPVISTEKEGYPMDNEDVYVSNSLGLPQKRVIFSGPLVLARRISNARKSRSQQVRRQQFNQSELSLALGITRPRSPYQRQTVRYRLQRGIFFPVRTFRKVKRRVKEARQQRARAALEARRERLKQSIGPKRITDPYAVGPFNHGVPYQDTGARPRNPRILLGDHVVG